MKSKPECRCSVWRAYSAALSSFIISCFLVETKCLFLPGRSPALRAPPRRLASFPGWRWVFQHRWHFSTYHANSPFYGAVKPGCWRETTHYTSVRWWWSVCTQNQAGSISLSWPDCVSQFLMESEVNAKARKPNSFLGEIHKWNNCFSATKDSTQGQPAPPPHIWQFICFIFPELEGSFRWLEFRWKPSEGGEGMAETNFLPEAATSKRLHNWHLQVISLESPKQLKK